MYSYRSYDKPYNHENMTLSDEFCVHIHSEIKKLQCACTDLDTEKIKREIEWVGLTFEPILLWLLSAF